MNLYQMPQPNVIRSLIGVRFILGFYWNRMVLRYGCFDFIDRQFLGFSGHFIDRAGAANQGIYEKTNESLL